MKTYTVGLMCSAAIALGFVLWSHGDATKSVAQVVDFIFYFPIIGRVMEWW